MTRNESWYEVVESAEKLTQGDLLFGCPLLQWNTASPPQWSGTINDEALRQAVSAVRVDVVVMTQACDLEHDKVRNVVLCPHLPLSRFRQLWENTLRLASQNPTEKAWKRTCDDIANGHVWNQAFLNRVTWDEREPALEIRVVDFHEVFTAPRGFLEAFLRQKGSPRLRLAAPYREHLSQAFARFFMRVGLPQPVDHVWS